MKILTIATLLTLTGSTFVSCKKDDTNNSAPSTGAAGYYKGLATLTSSPGTTFQVFLLNRADGSARIYSTTDVNMTDTANFDQGEGFWNLNNREYNGTFDRTIISGTLDASGQKLSGSFTNPFQANFILTKQ